MMIMWLSDYNLSNIYRNMRMALMVIIWGEVLFPDHLLISFYEESVILSYILFSFIERKLI